MGQDFCRSCTGYRGSGLLQSVKTNYAKKESYCPRCGAHIKIGDAVIHVTGDFSDEVKDVSSHLFSQANEAQMKKEELNNKKVLQKELTNNTLKLLVIGGGFWLGVFIAVFYMVFSLATANINWFRFVAALFVLPGFFTVLGAFILRTTSQISEKNFVELVKLTLNLNFKGLKFLSKQTPDEADRSVSE